MPMLCAHTLPRTSDLQSFHLFGGRQMRLTPLPHPLLCGGPWREGRLPLSCFQTQPKLENIPSQPSPTLALYEKGRNVVYSLPPENPQALHRERDRARESFLAENPTAGRPFAHLISPLLFPLLFLPWHRIYLFRLLNQSYFVGPHTCKPCCLDRIMDHDHR